MCIRDHSRLRTDKEKRSGSGCTAKRLALAGNPVSAGWCGQPSPAIAAKGQLRFCDGNRMKEARATRPAASGLQPINDGFTRRSRKKPEMVVDVPAIGNLTSHWTPQCGLETGSPSLGHWALNIHFCLAILPRSKEGSSSNRQRCCSWNFRWCVVQRLVQSTPFEHPALRCDETAPIGKTGNESQVINHMLQAYRRADEAHPRRTNDKKATYSLT